MISSGLSISGFVIVEILVSVRAGCESQVHTAYISLGNMHKLPEALSKINEIGTVPYK